MWKKLYDPKISKVNFIDLSIGCTYVNQEMMLCYCYVSNLRLGLLRCHLPVSYPKTFFQRKLQSITWHPLIDFRTTGSSHKGFPALMLEASYAMVTSVRLKDIGPNQYVMPKGSREGERRACRQHTVNLQPVRL